ncbi:MAG: DUF1552 domain-containing protein [Polyangiaceae bacterium]|nr:DUF1552 domain-containing protein [Polyangiaceae bacterium]
MNELKAPSRRRLLGTLSGAAAALVLPFFGRETRAQAGLPGPKRLLVLQTPDGRAYDLWRPTGSASNFQLGETMAAFEPLKSKLVVISGLDHRATTREPHCAGLVQWMTGRDGTFDGDNYTSAQAPSIDQLVATDPRFASNTRFRSLQFAADVTTTSFDVSHRYLSWAGPDLPLPGEHRPLENYRRLFGELVQATPVEMQRLIVERKSVMDVVKRDWQRMAAVIPAAQKPYFESHLTALRSLETEVASSAGQGQCAAPDTSLYPAGDSATSFPSYFKANAELVRLAFACDLTRVVTFMSSPTTSNLVHNDWALGMSQSLDHHGSSHNFILPNLRAINTWYTERIAEFVQSLEATPDGAKSLLDSLLMIYGSEFGDGQTHDHRNVPFVLFGSAGGQLQTGRFLNLFEQGQSRSSNDLWLSVLALLGVPLEVVGDPGDCDGPIPGL